MNVLLENAELPMTEESEMRETVDSAFITALLLSGDAKLAEAAALESIERMDPDDESGEELFQRVLKTAINRGRILVQHPKQMEPALSMLPIELQRVLLLPQYPRKCFVLRVLLGLSSDRSAELLGSEPSQVDQGACSALAELPSLA
jgi:DNA-directed RNA polymerase specialized sigma24 family protein